MDLSENHEGLRAHRQLSVMKLSVPDPEDHSAIPHVQIHGTFLTFRVDRQKQVTAVINKRFIRFGAYNGEGFIRLQLDLFPPKLQDRLHRIQQGIHILLLILDRRCVI